MKPAGVETGGVADVAEAPIRRTRRQKVFAVLPTLLTLCNAACGFGAITITAKVGPEHFGGSELFTASQLIFLAMLFDMLDGSAARLTNQTSDFGAFEQYIWSALVVLVPLVTLSAAVLMVSRLKYAHVFNQLVRGRRGRLQILQIVFSLVLVFIVRELALPVLFGYFAFSAPVRSLWQRLRRQPAAVREQL
jgi:phosphatidylserine synthase